MVIEPSPFHQKWFSHKFKGPGMICEVRVCIARVDIVWDYGPFPCKGYVDVTIFEMDLKRPLSNK